MYIFFVANIKEEKENLLRIFGQEYIAYKKRVNRMIFLPRFKRK
jgi:protein-S-isoprenylcysteine O-methyltransferase Ste14